MVFIPETEVTVPKLLFGQTNGLWRATVLQSSVSFEELQATSAISSKCPYDDKTPGICMQLYISLKVSIL